MPDRAIGTAEIVDWVVQLMQKTRHPNRVAAGASDLVRKNVRRSCIRGHGSGATTQSRLVVRCRSILRVPAGEVVVREGEAEAHQF